MTKFLVLAALFAGVTTHAQDAVDESILSFQTDVAAQANFARLIRADIANKGAERRICFRIGQLRLLVLGSGGVKQYAHTMKVTKLASEEQLKTLNYLAKELPAHCLNALDALATYCESDNLDLAKRIQDNAIVALQPDDHHGAMNRLAELAGVLQAAAKGAEAPKSR